jgi:hypothetical protein
VVEQWWREFLYTRGSTRTVDSQVDYARLMSEVVFEGGMRMQYKQEQRGFIYS